MNPDLLNLVPPVSPAPRLTVGDILLPWLARASREGLSLTALYIILSARKPVACKTICADLGISAPAVTATIQKLLDLGALERHKAGYFGDRREKLVRLSPVGRELLTRITGVSNGSPLAGPRIEPIPADGSPLPITDSASTPTNTPDAPFPPPCPECDSPEPP